MRKLALVLLVVIVSLSSAAMTAADGAAPDGGMPEEILWNQEVSLLNTNAYIDQDFEPELDLLDVYVADDFVNEETWTLRNIWVPGNASVGPDPNLTCAEMLHWEIYPDAGGVPDGSPDSGGAYWSLSLAPTDPQVQLFEGLGGFLTNAWLTPDDPPVVPPGTWWFSFYPEMSMSACGQYGRHVADSLRGYQGMVINPGEGWGFPNFWAPAPETYGFEQHEFAFRFAGTKNTLFVSGMRMSYVERQPGKFSVRGIVQIREMAGPRVPGATVEVEWTRPDGSTVTDSRVTKDPQGFAAFKLNCMQTGTYELCVTDVTKASYAYDARFNVTTCETIEVIPQ